MDYLNITGTFTATGGGGAKNVSLPPGWTALFSYCQVADPANAVHVNFSQQPNGQYYAWEDVAFYQLGWFNNTSGGIDCSFNLLCVKGEVAMSSYAGL